MTTTAAPFNTLTVPAPEDTMDMSSPANRPLADDDIEIDFDYQLEPATLTHDDDDHMLEDTTRPTTATDEFMDEDMQQGHDVAQDTVVEEVMQDDVVDVGDDTVTGYDEELIDYDEEDEAFQDDAGHTTGHLDTTDPLFPPSDALGDKNVHDIAAPLPEEADLTVTAPERSEDAATHDTHPVESGLLDEAEGAFTEDGLASYPDPTVPVPEETFGEEYEETHEEQQQANPDAEADQQPLTVDTTRTTSTEGPDTPTDTGLHPMTVRYHDTQLPLFRSKRQLDGLLKSDNLASLSLSALAEDCRKQLMMKDNLISEDQDIVLNFDQLGLMLVEDCHAAFDTSLHDVLEVYLQLHHNEGWEEIAPLSLTLSTQLKFQSSFTFLKNAAQLGQGISQFSFMQTQPEVEAEEQHFEEHEDVDEDAQHEDNHYADGEEHDETAGLEHDETAQDYAQDAHEQDPDQFEHQDYEDQADQQEYIDDQGEAAEALDGLAGDATDANYDQAAAEDQGTVLQHETAEEISASTVSSTTIQGDKNINTPTSKYHDEDLIDWDDHDLTPVASDTSTVGKYYEEDSIDWDDEDYLTSDTSDNSNIGLEDNALDTEYETTGEAKEITDEPQHPNSEDWLNDTPKKQAHGLPNQENVGDPYGAKGPAQYLYEVDEDFLNPDYQDGAAEDQEQYHTAHEGIFEGQEYEHELDHTEFQEEGQENGDEQPLEGQEEEEEFDDTVIIHPQPEGEEGEEEYYEEEAVQEQPHDVDEFEDEINFDEDDDEQQHQQPQLVESTAPETAAETSPRAKRSFDEIDDFDDDTAALELPEVKKVRSS